MLIKWYFTIKFQFFGAGRKSNMAARANMFFGNVYHIVGMFIRWLDVQGGVVSAYRKTQDGRHCNLNMGK